METDGKLYLGRIFDPNQANISPKPYLYNPDDLTTHAVVVGMTGSGKTGLCLNILEEAALAHIPALMIDPKGDITNALLHFPDLLPQDFQPWINPDQARRDGKTIEQAAGETAAFWKKGLADWEIEPERLQALKDAAQFAIYTPGSDAGISVNILGSLKAPTIPWEGNQELIREKISGTAIALLGLVGFSDIDPVRSREHILLSNIFEFAWKQGKDLDLGELIMQTQTPPFEKLGVFDINTFFPEKDRFGLAMLLNNIPAAPTFHTWIEGESLDIPSLLYSPDGRPRHSVFYIAHLTDAERMFFVTLLYSTFEGWMRSQTGTSSLRALLYFDEIFGYLPPVANPPSKAPMLRMLKQSRAFGVGQVLVTQNPVDLDYKALSNAGSWFIGKLQTDRDKQRLLDGLEGAMAGNLNRGEYDRLISTLGKRVFLLHNVHETGPVVFQTRWAMNYLAGPLTRAQIPLLNHLAGADVTDIPPALPDADATPDAVAAGVVAAGTVAAQNMTGTRTAAGPGNGSAPALSVSSSFTRPTLPGGIDEYFLPNNQTLNQAFKAAGQTYPEQIASHTILYRPVLLGQVAVRFLNRKYNLDYELPQTVLVITPDRRGVVRWENFTVGKIDPRALDEQPDPEARFAALEAPLLHGKQIAALQKDFLDWAYRNSQAKVWANETLKVYAGPDVSQAEFRTLCANAARSGRDAELKKVGDAYDKKLDVLQEKMAREQQELEQDEAEHSQRKMEELGSAAETVFGLFGKRRRSLSANLAKRRMTEEARADVKESKEVIADLKKQIADLEKEKAQALDEVNERWGTVANEVKEIPVTPLKKDVLLDIFGVAWFPYHLARVGEKMVELPGYGQA